MFVTINNKPESFAKRHHRIKCNIKWSSIKVLSEMLESAARTMMNLNTDEESPLKNMIEQEWGQ